MDHATSIDTTPPGELATALPISVLVVDDVDLVRRTMVRELTHHFRVVTASSAADALDQLVRCPDIAGIVSDLDLGHGPNGIALLEAVRRHRPWVVRFLATGSLLSAEERERLVEQGVAHRVFAKPWDRGAVLTAMRSTLGLDEGTAQGVRIQPEPRSDDALPD
jgi:CheY-like chemotaxis protein